MSAKCQQCKDWEFRELTGSWPSGQAFHRWALWGCTCDGGREQAAVVEMFTR